MHQTIPQRLLALLHERRAARLALLVAPAGFGKSQLAAAYAREWQGPTAWVAASAAHRDARDLVADIATALDAAVGEQAVSLRLVTQMLPLADGPQLARLIGEWGRGVPDVLLILDQLHLLGGAPDVWNALDTLVHHLPVGWRLVLCARDTPPMALANLLDRGDAHVITMDDLRWRPAEAQELPWEPEADGWIAGLSLSRVANRLGAVGEAAVEHYVECELLAPLDAADREWLTRLAVFTAITPDAARRLLGEGPWAVRLQDLAERFPFLHCQAGRYRFNGLIQQSLRRRVRRVAGPGETARLWTVAASLAEEEGELAAAVHAYRELSRSDDARACVLRAAQDALRFAQWSVALAALEHLAAEERREDPDLLLVAARAHRELGHHAPAHHAAEAALLHAGRSGNAAVQARALLELAALAYREGTLDRCDEWLGAAEYLLRQRDAGSADVAVLEAEVMGLRGAYLMLRGDCADARTALEAAQRLLEKVNAPLALSRVSHDLGVLLGQQGAHAEAELALKLALAQSHMVGDRVGVARAEQTLGLLHARSGRLSAATSKLARALEAARHADDRPSEALTLAATGEVARIQGRIPDARAAVDRALALLEAGVGQRVEHAAVLQQRAVLALLEGATGPAGAILDRAEAAIPRTSASATVAGIAIARGRLCLANGDVERAVSFCRRAQQLAEGGGLAYERVEALYWLGTALLARGQAQPALDALTEALALSDGATPPVALALCAAEDGRLLEYGLAAGIDRERLRDIEAFIREHRSGDRHVAPAPGGKRDGPVRPPIAAWLFGPLRIHRGDTFLPPEAWSRDRARELFALLALHPAGLSQEEICGLMWPALPVERAATGLHSAVYAVRRTLGGKASVQYVSGRYRLSDELDLWVDSRAFDVAVRRARAAVGQAAIEALERAVALYRGRLLEDVGWGWTADLRETFQGNFVDAALRLAHQLARTDRARADALAEQVLMLEPGCAAALDILRPEAPGRVRDALRVGAPGAVAMARPELMVVGPARKAVLAGADARASTGRRSRRGVPVHA